MPSKRSKTTARDAGLKHGWRSGLEESIGEQLKARRVPFKFEEVSIPFTQPVKPRTYTPDFVLPNGIVVETKGRFVTADRQKHLLVKAQHPLIDIRFVFSNSRARISKTSKTTYAAWCEAKGFLYADKLIPAGWFEEPKNEMSLVKLALIGKKK
jgi:hypothetical protein